MRSRNANYELLEINKLFSAAREFPDASDGNIQFKVEARLENAPLVLSRLIAIFQGLKLDCMGQSAYKVTWETALTHAETGFCITLYDYKGGISFGSDCRAGAFPPSFVRDVKKLIKVLNDPRCPHPYDGCAVGEEA